MNISGLTLSGKDAKNYTLVEKITGTITPAPVEVTANSQTINQGDSIPKFTYSYSGFIKKDSPIFTGTLAYDGNTNPGSYAITKNTLSAGRNYRIATYLPGIFIIKARAFPSGITADSLNNILSINAVNILDLKLITHSLFVNNSDGNIYPDFTEMGDLNSSQIFSLQSNNN